MRSLTRLVLTALALDIAACGSAAPPPRSSAADSHPQVAGNAIWVLADAQFNNMAGTNIFGQSADAFEEVAIRPPTLDMWSESVLYTFVDKISDNVAPAIFLGDGANTSCVGEYARFLDVMSRQTPHGKRDAHQSPVSWVGVIGNHDGYFMGNDSFPRGVPIGNRLRTP